MPQITTGEMGVTVKPWDGSPGMAANLTANYDTTKPLEIELIFTGSVEGDSVTWVVSRQVIIDGFELTHPSGEPGDFRMIVCEPGVRYHMEFVGTGPDDNGLFAVVHGDVQELADFIGRTEVLVPSGHEPPTMTELDFMALLGHE